VVPAAEVRARLKEGVHIERSPRRVRTYFGGKLIADSEHVLLVYETKRPPAYWFPTSDVRMEYLEQSQQPADTIRWRMVVKDRIAHNAARAYTKSTGDRAALEDHLTFYWNEMDAWFEEDEQVFVVRALRPVDDGQKWLRDQALTINENLLRDRWLMIGDQGRNVSPIMLGVLVSWVTLIFVGFGINAPRNAMVAASFLICAVVIGGAIFLILEMDRPVQGVLQISSWPIRNALAQMNW